MRARGLSALVVALSLLGASSASANVGPPLDLGLGQNPNVTLDPDGTANIAFTGQGANSTELDYCRLPRGATSCSVRTVIPAPGDSLTLPLAFGSGNNVNVISYRYGLTNGPFAQVLLFQSGDAGRSFAGPVAIGSIPPHDFAFGPGDTVSAVTDAVTGELDYQAWSLTAGTPGKAVLDGDPYEYQGTVAMVDPNTPLVVYASRGGDGRFRRYSGVGDVNNAASWAPFVGLGGLDSPHLVSGPSGVILVGQDSLSGTKMEARRYDGSNFGGRTTITEGAHANHAGEDADGRVHVVTFKYGGKTGQQFFYASSYDGSRWLTEGVDYPSPPLNLRLAVNADHYGTTVGTLYSNNHVFAAQLGPAAAEPTPGKFVGASVVSGTVLIRIPPSSKFVPLRPGDVVPVGSTIDATNGRVRVTIALPGGKRQSTDFFSGVFRVAQAKSGLATMALTGGSFAACKARRGSVEAAKAKTIRHLWGAGSGKFQTKGKYAAASIRGTTWDTIDRCDGTLIRVTKGKIAVTNLRTKRVVRVLKAGQSLLVKA